MLFFFFLHACTEIIKSFFSCSVCDGGRCQPRVVQSQAEGHSPPDCQVCPQILTPVASSEIPRTTLSQMSWLHGWGLDSLGSLGGLTYSGKCYTYYYSFL